MSFALDITHIGEALVAELINGNETVQENLKELAILASLPKKAEPNVSISNDSDPMHRIDVLVTAEDDSLTAIEVKFGTTITTPGEYCKRYLSKGDNDKKGNMLNKLASGKLKVKLKKEGEEKTIEIEKKWILLVRNKEISDKLTPENCRLGEKNKKLWDRVINNDNCEIITLGDLVDRISPEDFDKAVKKCIESDNYLKAWNI